MPAAHDVHIRTQLCGHWFWQAIAHATCLHQKSAAVTPEKLKELLYLA